MHGREKKRSPGSPSPKNKTVKINYLVDDDYVNLVNPKGFDVRESWLQQELDFKIPKHCSRRRNFLPLYRDSNHDINRLIEIFTICIEDSKRPTLVTLGCQLLLKFCLWQNNCDIITGNLEKVLLKRVLDAGKQSQISECAISTLTVLHVLNLLQLPNSYQDPEISPNNHSSGNEKYLESFFKILTNTLENVAGTTKGLVQSDKSQEEENNSSESYDQYQESSNSQEEEEEDEADEAEEAEEINEPQDMVLKSVMNAWVCLVSSISESTFDSQFPRYYEIFETLVKHHKNHSIKIAASEAIITLSDLNERLPYDKQYDIEIQPLVDQMYEYAKINAKSMQQKHKRQTWLNLAKALEANMCVVELPFINVKTKILVSMSKNNIDRRKFYQNREREVLSSYWSEAMTVKFIKNTLGHEFNGLMETEDFSSKIFHLLGKKYSNWNTIVHNTPLSMFYVQMKKNQKLSGIHAYLEPQWTTKWWKSSCRNQKRNDLISSVFV